MNSKKYLLHSSGIYTMLAWIEQQITLGTGTTTFQQTIFIPQLGSRRFALGISKNNKIKKTFLGIQPNESKWIQLINWDSIVIREKDNNMYLVSSMVQGDDIEYPDIPSFAVAIQFDSIDKLNLLTNIKKLEGREFFIDSDGAIRVNYHSQIFNLPIKHLLVNEPYLNEDEKITNYTDIMLNKERVLQSVFNTNAPPDFQGGFADIPESQSLFKKLKDKLL
jgi:hypothetical protein